MQLHELKPIHKIKKGKRVGRGGKRGTYSGRGMKGQKSRAGAKFEPIIRSLIKRYPKLRGYRFKGSSTRALTKAKRTLFSSSSSPLLRKGSKSEDERSSSTAKNKNVK